MIEWSCPVAEEKCLFFFSKVICGTNCLFHFRCYHLWDRRVIKLPSDLTHNLVRKNRLSYFHREKAKEYTTVAFCKSIHTSDKPTQQLACKLQASSIPHFQWRLCRIIFHSYLASPSSKCIYPDHYRTCRSFVAQWSFVAQVNEYMVAVNHECLIIVFPLHWMLVPVNKQLT